MIVLWVIVGLAVYVAAVSIMCVFMGGLSRLERRIADHTRTEFDAIVANAYDDANK